MKDLTNIPDEQMQFMQCLYLDSQRYKKCPKCNALMQPARVHVCDRGVRRSGRDGHDGRGMERVEPAS